MGLGEFGVEFDGRPVLRDGLVQLVPGVQNEAEVACMRPREDRRPKVRD